MGSILHWKTTDSEGAVRFDSWVETLNRVYGSWEAARPHADVFDAEIAVKSGGNFQIAECICDPCGASRTRDHIQRDGAETVTFQVVISGNENFSILDQRIALNPGDVLVWNSTVATKFEVVSRLRKISVSVPLARLRSWMPNQWRSVPNYFPNYTMGAHMLSSFIGLVSPSYLSGELSNGEALTESLLGLLVNCVGDGKPSNTSLRSSQLQIVKEYISARLADPNLSIAMICRANRISIRYLHALFETEGITAQRHIVRQRLLRCARELESPSMIGRTLTEIAFSWGFQNSTHFSRRFREEFGTSPKLYRQAAMKAGQTLADRLVANS